MKVAVCIVLPVGVAQLAWQAWRAGHAVFEDGRNPYAYAETAPDVPALARQVEQIAAAHPDGLDMPVQVICPDGDYWPLPWYLRKFRRVGWCDEVPEDIAKAAAPVIICKPSVEPSLVQKLFGSPPAGSVIYEDMSRRVTPGRDIELRAGVPLRAYVRADLWQALGDRPDIRFMSGLSPVFAGFGPTTISGISPFPAGLCVNGHNLHVDHGRGRICYIPLHFGTL